MRRLQSNHTSGRPAAPWVALVALSLALSSALGACQDANNSPTLDPVADQKVAVGQELEVLLTARDPDGDSLSFTLVAGPDGATVHPLGTTAFLRWAPLINQVEPGGTSYTATVRVEDGRGGQAERDVHIMAYPVGGTPVFLNPSGFVVNLAYATRVAFLVEVKDDDTDPSKMTLRLVSGIEGADFNVINGKQASFYWKPTAAQIAESSYRSIVVGADDGVHPEVQQEISIILLNAETGHCQGAPPSIQHVPHGDVHGGAGYEVTAEATDQDTLVASMTLLWSTTDATDAQMKSLTMKLSDGLWRATIPAASLSGSQTATIRYAMIARDNDDITGTACDHETRSPKAGVHAFWAYADGTAGACAEDAREPNDSAEQSTPLTAGEQTLLRACGGDDDWFSVAVAAGQSLAASARWEPSHGAMDLTLLDGAGATLGEAKTPGSPLVWGPAKAPTSLLLRARSPEGTAMAWSLSVELSDKTCTDDALEPDDGPLAAKPVQTGITDGLVICPDNHDWYAIDAAAGQILTAAVLFDHAVGDLDAVLYAPDGVTPVASSETETSNETITYTVTQTGTWLLEVRGFKGQTNAYEVAISLAAAGDVCKDDILAPNQTPEKAAVLPAAAWEGLTACPGTQDWYAYGLNGGETLFALAQPEDPAQTLPAQTLKVRLHAADGDVIGESGSDAQGGAWGQHVVPSAGTYLIEVRNEGGATVPYAFALAVTEPDGPCVDDRFEPNDTPDTGRPTEPGIVTRGKVCGSNTDWYRVFIGAFETATFWLLFEQASGDLDVRLYDSEGELVGGSTSTSDDELLEVLVDKGGYYDVEVRGKGAVSNAYDLVFFTED